MEVTITHAFLNGVCGGLLELFMIDWRLQAEQEMLLVARDSGVRRLCIVQEIRGKENPAITIIWKRCVVESEAI